MTAHKQKPRSIFVLPETLFRMIYNDAGIAAIQRMTQNTGSVISREEILSNPESFKDVEVIFSGWGAPKLDNEFLDVFPSLRAFFYGAGSVRGFVTEDFWKRDVLLTSAYQGNAVPVAEFTMASVIFSLKRAWQTNYLMRSGVKPEERPRTQGVYVGSKVGIISLGAIGRLVCEKLAALNLDVYAYDPFADDALFEQLRVQRVETLEELFTICEVVSLHAPWLKETEDLVTGDMLRSMPENGTFINTSRGAIVDEPAMIQVLQERPDLFAVLDLVKDEQNVMTNPLRSMPNVFMTPHIAGSMGRECHRLGAMAVEECRRLLSGEPQLCPLNRESAARLA